MSFEPHIAQKGPFVCDEEVGKKRAWCACGLSAKQPYCDGTHGKQNTGMSPLVVSVEKAKVAWCGCKRTGTPPYCDGSHARLG